MVGFYFALWSGDEHYQLRYSPCHIQIVEKPRERPYLLYMEDMSKNRPGGLKGHKCKPKVITRLRKFKDHVQSSSHCSTSSTSAAPVIPGPSTSGINMVNIPTHISIATHVDVLIMPVPST